MIASRARRLHHCRDCRRDTAQAFLFSENGYPQNRTVETYRCDSCGLLLLSMGDVPDADGLCLWVIGERFRRNKANGSGSGKISPVGRPGDRHQLAAVSDDRWLDYDDALGHLREQIVLLWAKWDPALGVPFRAFATGQLRNDLIDWIRAAVGRDRPKPFANALALDALDRDDEDEDGRPERGGGLEALLGGALDADTDSLAALRREAVRRNRELAELDRKYCGGANA